MSNHTTLPNYGEAEERINVITHAIGTIMSVISAIIMVILSILNKSLPQLFGALIFGLSLIWLYTMSTLYHNEKNLDKRRVRQKLDHLSINILIAGSNTIFMVAGLANNFGYIATAIVWGLSIISMILNSINVKKFRAPTMVIYIVTGWAPAVLFSQIIDTMGMGGFGFLLAGGLFYTFGLIFYAIKKKYMHAIWHIFVLSGSLCHIIASIAYILLA